MPNGHRLCRAAPQPAPRTALTAATTLVVVAILLVCHPAAVEAAMPADNAHPAPAPDQILTGGIRLIPVETPRGEFRVWVKRVGDNPTVKVLLLHGGPGATHEYLEAFTSFLPDAGVEFYFYDQLGSYYSDPIADDDLDALVDLPRFVEEVEQVRQALGLGPDNFFLYGQSWGGILAMEYALKHQQHLRGLIISNMMASVPAYNAYARDVIMPAMDPDVLARIQAFEAAGDFENPEYTELLVTHHYVLHVLRMPPDQWPDPVNRTFKHLNGAIYVPMQGPSELGASGKLAQWDRTADLPRITVPTLVMAATHDTMDPEHLRWMADTLPRGRYHLCPDGSHMALYDDQQVYFRGLIDFLADVDAGRF